MKEVTLYCYWIVYRKLVLCEYFSLQGAKDARSYHIERFDCKAGEIFTITVPGHPDVSDEGFYKGIFVMHDSTPGI